MRLVGAGKGTIRGRLALVVAVLVVLLAVLAAFTVVVRLRVSDTQNRVNDVLIPAVRNASALSQAYVDQETAERGFLLTGSASFLTRYTQAAAGAARAEGRIAAGLRGDVTGTRLLAAVTAAGRAWQATGVEPEIAARQAGTLPTGDALSARLTISRALFGQVRTSLANLQHYIGDRIAAKVNAVSDAQTTANIVAAATVVAAVLVALVTVAVYRRTIARPFARLLDQVGTVAAGHLDQPVEASGPDELATIGTSVEAMRARILADTKTSAALSEQLAVRAESDRIARDLHDVVIQRLFAAGLRLLALGSHHPQVATESRELVDDLDASIRELRAVIFGLTVHQTSGGLSDRVRSLVAHSERSLGFAPKLSVHGPVDDLVGRTMADQVIPALGELLTNVARHARASAVSVLLDATPDRLCLVVADDGVGILARRVVDADVGGGRGLVNLQARAEALGGGCVVRPGEDGGTVVEWSIPLVQSPIG